MGVQGFPTLKIVRPSKKPGKPVVEDYQGPREARGIVEAVKAAIPNSVKRITDKGLTAFLDSDNDTAKAILFSEKGTTSALIKVIGADYTDRLQMVQIRNKEARAVEMFGISDYPTLLVLPGGTKDPVRYDGEFTKSSMESFLDKFAQPKEEAAPKKKKQPKKASEEKLAESSSASSSASSEFSEASSAHASAEASEAAASATSETLEDASNPTESPEPIVAPDEEQKPIVVPDQPDPIPALIEQKWLQDLCLGAKTSTCILALLPKATDDESTSLPEGAALALASLAELRDKHIARGGHLFPFYSIPARNQGAVTVRDSLGLKGDTEFELVAVNGRRGWWRRYEGEKYDFHSVEDWVDAIRLGEGQKGKIPDGLVVEEAPQADDHDEL